MDQADRVFSTPPTNTSAIDAPQSPGKPRTRRSVLGAIAAGATALTLAPARAAPAADPIYAAIDAFRRAHALFFAEYVDDIPDEIGDQYSAACSVMQRTRPTTPAGLAVLTAWAREQADWLCANSSVLNSEDYCALTASIDDATQGMSGLEPWSPPLQAAAAIDPIYAAIERHKDLAKTYDAAWKIRGRCKDFGTLTEAEKAHLRELDDATDAAGLPLEAAAMNLFDTVPTTHAGIITALFYMRIQHRNDGEHMIQGWFEDEDGERYIDWRDAWLETLIQAVLQLDDAAVQS